MGRPPDHDDRIAAQLVGIFLAGDAHAAGGINLAPVNRHGFVDNLIPVTLGNIVGGSVLVALVYDIIYGRKPANCRRAIPLRAPTSRVNAHASRLCRRLRAGLPSPRQP